MSANGTTVDVNPDGNHQLPAQRQTLTGNDAFTYTITDANGDTD